ncbi:MAG: histidine phosphatase family protein [Anaerolineales bacterium]|nr:histidine phosphatase family protein [Anaerolineales bacterium]
MTPLTRIILIRHGQTEWNRAERFRGRADVPLNGKGLRQAEATARRVAAEWKPAAVYSSPLSRAFQTGEAVARRFGLTVQPHPGLIDLDFGECQGLSLDEVRARWPETARDWMDAPHKVVFPGGESLPIVRFRAMSAIRELTPRHTGGTVALIGHAVVNRLILLDVMGLGNERYWRIQQENCAINVLETDMDYFMVVCFNDTCHLRDSK